MWLEETGLANGVFQICDQKQEASTLAKEAFDTAIDHLDTLGDDEYKDSTLIMQLLKDNLTLWNNDELGADDGDDIDALMRRLTPAQRRHMELQEQRAALASEQAAAMTHREKVQAFNEKLAALTEHHDIPRVSAAGNG